MKKRILLLSIVQVVMSALTIYAQGEEVPPPPIGLDLGKIFVLLIYIFKGSVMLGFILSTVLFGIKSLIAGIESQQTGIWGRSRAMSNLWENVKGYMLFFGVLAFIAWLPDILNWLGYIPEALKPYVVDWNTLFGK